MEVATFGKIIGHFLPIVPPFAAGVRSCRFRRGDTWWRELECSNYWSSKLGVWHSVKTFLLRILNDSWAGHYPLGLQCRLKKKKNMCVCVCVCVCVCIYMCVCVWSVFYIYIYTGCPRRNGQNFGRVFLMLNYSDITQNTYIQSWTVMEIMAIEKCGLLGCPRIVCRPWHHTRPVRMPGNETPLANIVMQWPWRDNATAEACVNYLET